MDKQKIWEEFFRLYNEGLANEYEKVMENLPDESKFNNPKAFAEIKQSVFENINDWYDIKFQELGNKTPRDIVDNIKTFDEATFLLNMAFENCDDDIPLRLKLKFESFGDEAIEELENMAFYPPWEGRSEEEEPDYFLIKSSCALKLLGDLKSASSAFEILAKFCDTKKPDEFIADAVKEYFVSLEESGISALMDTLNSICDSENDFSVPYEYLLISLTSAGRMNKIDEIYLCIRNCFRKMPEKIIPAICIGDYGDPRGIALLKGYIEKNQGNLDRQFFYEALSSIKRLGGQTDDIQDPFRDFS
jgi:hypothetical protein